MGKFTLNLDGPLLQIPKKLKNESFDYVGRYQLVGEILSRYFAQPPKNVLDVGGRGGFLDILTDASVTILDEEGTETEKVSKGDGSKMDIKDNSYDAVITCDTLEHIPKKDRKKFINELIRVSNDLVILCAPFSDYGAANEEKALQKNFSNISGNPHRWLKEHADYVLPKFSETLKLFKDSGYSVVSFGHSSLTLWRSLMQANLVSHEIGSPAVHKELQSLNSFYNSLLFKDFSEQSYRIFIVLSKTHTLSFKKSKATLSSEDYISLFRLLGNFSDAVLAEAEKIPVIHKKITSLTKENTELADIKQRYQQILNSTTWRYTTPLRKVGRVVRNAKLKDRG